MKLSIYLSVLFTTTILFGQNTYLHCGKLIDTKEGKVLTNKTIVVSGKKIFSVENGFVEPKSPEDQVIDLKDKTVMPGLTDMHVHMEMETSPDKYLEGFILNDVDFAFRSLHYAEVTLMAGFTTVRDLGGSGINVSLRNAINQGLVVGPRIFTAEKSLATTGGHADPTNGVNNELMGGQGPKKALLIA